jgi:hypothetical protein
MSQVDNPHLFPEKRVLMQIILLEKKIYDTSLPLTKEDD